MNRRVPHPVVNEVRVWDPFVRYGEHARFSDFLYAPRLALSYFTDLLRGRAKRYIGHSPAGAAMVFAMFVSLALTVSSGLVVYTYDKHSGPLAGWVHPDASEPVEEFWEETHQVLANVTLALALLHVSGVVMASVLHREKSGACND